MKRYDKLFLVYFFVIAVISVMCNLSLILHGDSSGREYRVEVNRVANEIERNGFDSLDLSQYHAVTSVYQRSEEGEDFFQAESDYVIRDIKGTLYRIEYTADAQEINEKRFMINAMLLLVVILSMGTLLFVRQKVLKPFEQIREIPYELSKGNLTIPLKESRNRFFGRFTWGLDLLREHLESQKQRELQMQKEKNTLLLSLSHDIKTPLSAIKLYAKALSKGLYEEKESQIEIADRIDKKADEIEGFVAEIIRASSEDFLNLEVKMEEFYLSEVIDKISDYYTEKLKLIKTDFSISEYSDCILRGDADRVTEVLQNIMENAIKYGDGRKIELLFEREEECRLITVANSGCQLKDSELSYIFDSFWRGSNTGNHNGSGLGLYICKKLMMNMDGDIFAEIHGGAMSVTVVIREP